MGTRTDSTNTKKAGAKSEMTVALAYRGLLDILHKNHDTTTTDIMSHLRSFDRVIDDPREMHLQEVSGFWRMTMELVLRTYLHINLGVGILLLSMLMIISWPIYFLVVSFSAGWSGMTARTREAELRYAEELARAGYADPALEPTAPANDNDKVVRRVVYEEAKVGTKGNSK
jgi:hypothetical protein